MHVGGQGVEIDQDTREGFRAAGHVSDIVLVAHDPERCEAEAQTSAW
jgi:hypothetical protein